MTELIWDGKYDKNGKRTAPPRIILPFQTVETINESTQQRQQALSLFASGRDSEWRNRLIWGDKKYVLPSLLEEFAGKVNLIYIDPPFNVGADFSYTASIPDAPEDDESGATFVKEPSIIEQKAYRDTWGRGLDSYLQWFYETVVTLRELIAENGSIYVHLDWHVSHAAKCVLDEVFGVDNFVNEIIWQKIRSSKGQSRAFGNVHDSIFIYAASASTTFNPQYVPLHEDRLRTHYANIEPETGRRYMLDNFSQAGQGEPRMFGKKILSPPPGKHWIWSQERIDEGIKSGRVVITSGGMPRVKRYLDESKGNPIEDIWTDVSPLNSQSEERVEYPTQKPELLLERILNASSKKGDLVLDCFCGSGTTAAVAEKLNRRWITCDLGRFAIHTGRKRLLSIPDIKPFVVQNLGKYERQVWQESEFGEKAQIRVEAYRKFILELYHARPVTGMVWLHGVKAGRMVHVGAVDSPVSVGDVTAMVAEFKKSIGKGKDAPSTNGIDVLGWDFAFELNEVAKQHAAKAGVNVRFVRIPRETMEKKAVEQGDVKFFELAALAVDVKVKKRSVVLTLNDFTIPPDDVPEDVQKAIKHWSQWIDYWAVDWDNKGDNFHNEWQTYRTRQNPELVRTADHDYEEPGEYVVCVKVIDILGNDTTKTLTVKVT